MTVSLEQLARWMSSRDGKNLEFKEAKMPARNKGRKSNLSAEQLEEMIEEATVDAYGEDEQLTGFFTMFEEYLELPFDTKILGTNATVDTIEFNYRSDIVAICTKGKERQPIPLLDLPLPSPRPKGADWIEAYRHWAKRTGCGF